MTDEHKSDEEIIGEVVGALGFGRRTRRVAPKRPAGRLRWTDSDNLHAREALVEGGPYDGLRVSVNEKAGVFRWPDVIDLSGYDFVPSTWTFVERQS